MYSSGGGNSSMREMNGQRTVFAEHTIYIVGNAKTSQNNPIIQLYG